MSIESETSNFVINLKITNHFNKGDYIKTTSFSSNKSFLKKHLNLLMSFCGCFNSNYKSVSSVVGLIRKGIPIMFYFTIYKVFKFILELVFIFLHISNW